jgi:hypothetical protein
MATGFRTKGFKSDLKIEPGIHRFTWDMRYTGFSVNGKNGILASPGNYLITFNYGEKNYTQNFKLLIDPRLEKEQISTAILRQQVELALQIRDLEWKAKQLSTQIKKSLSDFEKSSPEYILSLEIDKLLNTSKSMAYSQPMLIDQILYLREMLNTADQLPGKDAFDRFKELNMELENLLNKWSKKSNVPAVSN